MAKRENRKRQNNNTKPTKNKSDNEKSLKNLTKKKEKAGHRRDSNKDFIQIGDRNSNKNLKEENKKNNNFVNRNNLKGKYQTNNFGNRNNNNNNNNRRKFDNKKDKTENTFYNEELEIANNNQENDFFDFNSNSNIFTKLKNSEPNKVAAQTINKENKGNFLLFYIFLTIKLLCFYFIVLFG